MALDEKIKSLPPSPGVYMMKGPRGVVLYIGKAKNLRARVRSYFKGSGDGRYAVKFLVSKTTDLDYIVTANEKEALILEDTLLKKHKPRYNIRLKDDKTYVSIKITTTEVFPRILVTRRVVKDGSRYFGPYASAGAVRETVKFIRRVFPLCVCTPHEFRNRVRPCLDYQLGICSSPATGLISKDDYAEFVEGTVMFLEGRNRELLRKLKRNMKEASAAHCFEEAAGIRDRIQSIEAMLEEQKVVSTTGVDRDVFALAREEEKLAVQALFIREGRLVGTRDFTFDDTGLPDGELLGSFLSQFYRGGKFVPDEVLVPALIEGRAAVAEWLTDKKGRKVEIRNPARGGKVKLIKMAEANAREALKKAKESGEAVDGVTAEMKRRLRLKTLPRTIEAFDISNIGGREAVGAMVTFTGGRADKNRYRRYKIKGVAGPDDYAMMHEVLSRRYADTEKAGKTPLPDLVLVDGGKGQLGIAVSVMRELGIEGVELAALAKDKNDKGERVFRPGVKDPVLLREGSKADLLLRRIRDEVHRFAVTYHRKLRGKAVSSVLDRVPGIGRKKRALLFEKFGDLDGIRKASVEELTAIPGITEKIARALKKDLK
ncbi:MAG: excinuclease ABC subunit UvrC [Thermodesulfobacteriota bacterium]